MTTEPVGDVFPLDAHCGVTLMGVARFQAADKASAVEALARRVADDSLPDAPIAPVSTLLSAALDREALGSTLVSQTIAFPHAIIPSARQNVVCIAVTDRALVWDPPDKRVRVVAFFAGAADCHLSIMSRLARVLREETVMEELLAAPTDQAVVRAVSARLDFAPATDGKSAEVWNDRICSAATRFSSGGQRSAVALVASTFSSGSSLDAHIQRHPPDLLLTTDDGSFTERLDVESGHAGAREREIPVYPIVPVHRHDERTLFSVIERERARGGFGLWDELAVLWGEVGSDRLSHLYTHRLVPSGAPNLPVAVSSIVFDRAIQLARDLSLEGREGKSVGVIFVIGDVEQIQDHSHQMIINPFAGCPAAERNVLDPGLEETVKEFAKIDGAFVIDGDGVIASAGTYLSVARQDLTRRAGLGARHASAQAITAVCDCVSIVVSESTRRITVFMDGAPVSPL